MSVSHFTGTSLACRPSSRSVSSTHLQPRQKLQPVTMCIIPGLAHSPELPGRKGGAYRNKPTRAAQRNNRAVGSLQHHCCGSSERHAVSASYDVGTPSLHGESYDFRSRRGICLSASINLPRTYQVMSAGNYSTFMYLEEDILLTWPTLLSWARDTELLEPLGMQRSMFRVEVAPWNGRYVLTDETKGNISALKVVHCSNAASNQHSHYT